MNSSNPRAAPKKPTVPWAVPDSTEPLRQCDVLRLNASSEGRFATSYMILTADCDLAHEKHYGQVLCLPIISLETYFKLFRLPRMVEKHLAQSNGKLIDHCHQLIMEMGLKYSKERIYSWLVDEGIEHFLETVTSRGNGVPQMGIDVLTAEIRNRWCIDQVHWRGHSLGDCLNLIQRVKKLDNQRLNESVDLLVKNEIQNLVGGNTPKDVSILAEISQEDASGFVILHRFPEIIRDDEISLVASNTGAFVRISRIIEPYSRQIINQFGQLFSSVGLPDEHSESVEIAGKIAISNILKGI